VKSIMFYAPLARPHKPGTELCPGVSKPSIEGFGNHDVEKTQDTVALDASPGCRPNCHARVPRLAGRQAPVIVGTHPAMVEVSDLCISPLTQPALTFQTANHARASGVAASSIGSWIP